MAKMVLAEQAEILLLRGRFRAFASGSHLQRMGQEMSCGGLESGPAS
jgi:hypothetical protein